MQIPWGFQMPGRSSVLLRAGQQVAGALLSSPARSPTAVRGGVVSSALNSPAWQLQQQRSLWHAFRLKPNQTSTAKPDTAEGADVSLVSPLQVVAGLGLLSGAVMWMMSGKPMHPTDLHPRHHQHPHFGHLHDHDGEHAPGAAPQHGAEEVQIHVSSSSPQGAAAAGLRHA